MKNVAVSSLEPGKYFTKPVYLDDTYILLTPETPVPEELLARLKEWSFDSVVTEGESIDKPVASPNDSGDSIAVSVDQDVRETRLFKEAEEFFGKLLAFVEQVFTGFVTKSTIPASQVSDMVKSVIDMVKSHRRYMLRLSEMKAKERNYIVTHSAKTTVVAVAVGQAMKQPSHKLIEIGTAALLHEIGMVRLPPQLYMSTRQLSDKERQAVTAHTLLGFKTLRQQQFPMQVCLAVLECKENVNGTGYPRKLTGEKIGLYAKIIMVASSFVALTSERPYREPLDGHAAILEMLKHRGKMYDEVVLKGLVALVSVFPIGTFVELSDGTFGMVVDTNPENPRAPQVRVMYGPSRERYAEQPIVDTAAHPESAVTRALPPDDPIRAEANGDEEE
jgi:HD-GYP domain-containing protein (c-di-GMP phosphodiesterase class II)